MTFTQSTMSSTTKSPTFLDGLETVRCVDIQHPGLECFVMRQQRPSAYHGLLHCRDVFCQLLLNLNVGDSG